ncbi:hypothetical protein SAMN04487967_3624 [Natronorubrum sediminis]|uniref:Uncharacterized protein n=1 Tax=Natronorubrum sediminis TaxID=640943 RepID=A0A1H6G6M7_9EURY|nr:hypothetical protein [Natronorubrum sediminis]SEH18098.1 hypothetical protein SAMN04487967_3624 [Natronorubrum sediminis]
MDDDRATTDDEIERLRSRPPGHDSDDPYEDVTLETLPDWWAQAVRLFENHNLRPFRPSRFADGELTHEVVDRLERDFDVTIRIAGVDVRYGDDWTVFVDDELVASIPRRRSRDGHTVFERSSAEFESIIRSGVGDQ